MSKGKYVSYIAARLALFILIFVGLLSLSQHSVVAQDGTPAATQEGTVSTTSDLTSRIVFIPNEGLFQFGKIQMMDPEGKNRAELPISGFLISLSPNGRFVASAPSLLDQAKPSNTDSFVAITVMDVNGSHQHSAGHFVIAKDEQGGTTGAAWSPDNKQLFFIFYKNKRNKPDTLAATAYFVNTDGSGEPQEVKFDTPVSFPPLSVLQRPIWSPDGKHILFRGHLGEAVKSTDESVNLLLDVDTQHVAPFPIDAANPMWSPNGKHLAFIRLQGKTIGTAAIAVADADGSNAQDVTDSKRFQAVDFAWSPDGSQIVCTGSDIQNHYHLYLMNADGSNLHSIADINAFNLNWGLVPPDLIASLPVAAAGPPTSTIVPSRTAKPSPTPRPSRTPVPSRTPKPSITPKT